MKPIRRAIAVIALALGMVAASLAPVVGILPEAYACNPYHVAYAPWKSGDTSVSGAVYFQACGYWKYQVISLSEPYSPSSQTKMKWSRNSSTNSTWYITNYNCWPSQSDRLFTTGGYMHPYGNKYASSYLKMHCSF